MNPLPRTCPQPLLHLLGAVVVEMRPPILPLQEVDPDGTLVAVEVAVNAQIRPTPTFGFAITLTFVVVSPELEPLPDLEF